MTRTVYLERWEYGNPLDVAIGRQTRERAIAKRKAEQVINQVRTRPILRMADIRKGKA